jgi:hypothetical protein
MVLLEDNEADRIHVKNGTLHLKFKYYIAMGRLTHSRKRSERIFEERQRRRFSFFRFF